MAIQNELPYGGTGWHGDNAVSLRSTIGDLQTLSNDIHDQWTAIMGELNTSGDLAGADVTYALVAPKVEAGANFELETLIHIAQGGSYVHGDNAVMLREFLAGIVAVGNEVYGHLGPSAGPGLLVDLNGVGGDADYNDWSPVDGANIVAPVPAAGRAMHPRFANGREASHGDQGVQVRLALEEMVLINNVVKESVNGIVAKMDLDGAFTGTYGPFAITAPDVS